MQTEDTSYARFPLWLEWSGLPLHLNEKAKAAYAWAVFHKLVELDIARNLRRPGLIEISLDELGALCGLTDKQIEKSVKGMRKAGLLRAFLPDNPHEEALFQFITPIPAPLTADEVRARHDEAFLDAEWPPRYAVSVEEEEDSLDPDKGQKLKKVVDLYLNVVSMKMNAFILDELRLIAQRYDLPLVEAVFERARKQDKKSLSWIMTEIRREKEIKQKAEEIRGKSSQL